MNHKTEREEVLSLDPAKGAVPGAAARSAPPPRRLCRSLPLAVRRLPLRQPRSPSSRRPRTGEGTGNPASDPLKKEREAS